MLNWNKVKVFWDYLVYYPDEDEEGYDGIHAGGIKGIRDDAPEEAKEAFYKFMEERNEAIANGIKL